VGQTESVTGGRLTDWISLGVLASWVPADAIDDAVEATGKGERRRGGKLPPRVVSYLVMALALFADEDYEEVAARLAGTFADWTAGRSPGTARRPRAGSPRPGSDSAPSR
jgi:transposase IS4-like protein